MDFSHIRAEDAILKHWRETAKVIDSTIDDETYFSTIMTGKFGNYKYSYYINIYIYYINIVWKLLVYCVLRRINGTCVIKNISLDCLCKNRSEGKDKDQKI